MRIRKPGRWILLLLVLGVGAYYGAGALRWYLPPELEVDGPATVPAFEPFQLDLGVSKPVTFEVEYAGTRVDLPRASEEWTLFLPAVAGATDVVVNVTDSAGNVVTRSLRVTGLRPATVVTSLPDVLANGDPVAVHLAVDDPDGYVQGIEVRMGGERVPLFALAGGLAAFSAVSLESGPGELPVDVLVTDVFGRDRIERSMVPVTPADVPVDVLQLAAEVLDLMSDENRAIEAEMFERAYADLIERPVWTEPFLLPSDGFGTSGFGDPRRYVAGGPVSYHEGADIAAPAGTPVLATNRGEVLVAGFYPLKGGFVMLDHGGGVTSHYAHLREVHVVPGQVLARGELLGDMGTTGISTGPHLHWEMRIRGVASHPLHWVDRLVPGIVPGSE